MKHPLLLACLFVLCALGTRGISQPRYAYQDTTISIDDRVSDLLLRLTLDEKISLMAHQNPGIPRLGLKPYSWWNEALHGVARNGFAEVYPMPIGLAATWDPELIEQVFHNIGLEAHMKFVESQRNESYLDNTGLTFFTPNINIFRDPRWGRGMETWGEDPYLTGRMGLAVVLGLQGRDTNHLLTAACIKHLAVHSGPEGLRHEFDSRVTPRDLWTTYLPAFEYIIKRSNVQQVMCGYNRLNGIPCCTNRELLVDILRNQWHYNGMMVTDCWALNDCWEQDTVIPRHRTHASAAYAAADAFGSEIDLECGSGQQALREALDSGYFSAYRINQHVRRILKTRLLVGVDQPRVQTFAGYEPLDKRLPLQSASASLVMLKNNDLLPFTQHNVAVVGPNANDSIVALGNYNGTPRYVTTVVKAFRNMGKTVYYDRGCNHADKKYQTPSSYWKKIKKNDIIVFVGGLSPELEGEELQVDLPGFSKGDRTQIELPQVQVQMIKDLKKKTGKPIVLVLFTGSAIALDDVIDDVDAIVVGWYGGQDIGTAVANALTKSSHSFGRLPVTFYKSTSQLPDFADYNMKGRTYRYMTEEPLFPFGFGLEYKDKIISDLQFDRHSLTLNGMARSKGIGNVVVQIYLKNLDDPNGPKKSLVGFERIKSYGDTHFSIEIEPDMLRYFNSYSQQLEMPKPGTRFVLMVGTSSDDKDLQEIPFTY